MTASIPTSNGSFGIPPLWLLLTPTSSIYVGPPTDESDQAWEDLWERKDPLPALSVRVLLSLPSANSAPLRRNLAIPGRPPRE